MQYERARQQYRESLADRQDLLMLALAFVDRLEGIESNLNVLEGKLTFVFEELLVPGTQVPGKNVSKY